MSSVEGKHFGQLLGGVLSRIRDDLAALAETEFEGLRASHFRLLDLVPAAGARPSDLVRPAGMSKQALGQFFTYLQERGYVDSLPDPADRRARIVRRTALGDRARARSAAVIAERERMWAELVGPRRFATFRAVLGEIAADANVL